MDLNAAVAAVSAIAGACTGGVAMLAFRWSEREQTRETGTAAGHDSALPPGVDTVLSVLRSSAVVLDEADRVVKASSAAYALGLVRGGRLAVEQMLQMARETRRDGEIRQGELDLPTRSGRGEPLAVSARVAPLGSRLVLLLVEDLTEARRIEAVRRDFVANVSHELKTPVGALSLLSEAVMDASDDPEAVIRFAGRMQHEATRLTSLVQEIIDLSRVQNDDPLVDAEAVDVDDLIAEAVDRCRHPANSKHISIVVPECPGLFVWGHRGQLAAALGNLVENAVNYSPAHTRVGLAGRRVREAGGDLVEISVTDQGTGISQTDRERIFERFYRVDPARSRATGGTGLGLSIVKHVAASHGGEVTVWSAEGQGSTFTLRLPEAARRTPEQPAPGTSSAGSPVAPASGGPSAVSASGGSTVAPASDGSLVAPASGGGPTVATASGDPTSTTAPFASAASAAPVTTPAPATARATAPAPAVTTAVPAPVTASTSASATIPAHAPLAEPSANPHAGHQSPDGLAVVPVPPPAPEVLP
ncbi:ATP-binding protein [Streptomyces sp. SL13]|uniref:Sensor-like histidine kinase SenX3 n=1 Tax=Streptantibioticus silvisoli TaxID=2705255 RepID=A0AA90KFN4_9ACTN|nr:ATP-binding protein [Streptantibioticus silvisoli]MDI5969510.1 ATP-binding protein [Streptantibioticus silvisoli]